MNKSAHYIACINAMATIRAALRFAVENGAGDDVKRAFRAAIAAASDEVDPVERARIDAEYAAYRAEEGAIG